MVPPPPRSEPRSLWYPRVISEKGAAMSKFSRQWAVAAVVVGLGALLVAAGRSQSNERQQSETHGDGGFVKASKYPINTDHTLFTDDHGKASLLVVLGSGSNIPTISLTGAEAYVLRRWLDGRSVDLNALTDAHLRKSRVLMEGVDILCLPGRLNLQPRNSRSSFVKFRGVDILDRPERLSPPPPRGRVR
jgi:hypothetical protein